MFDKPLMIFDCDGVLVDSEAIYLEEEFAELSSRGIEIDRLTYQAEFMALAQPLWKAKFSKLIEDNTGKPLSQTDYDAMKHRVRNRVLNELTVVAGVENMLATLKGPACVASTTAMKFLPGKLERTNLFDFFGGGVYSGDMVQNGKPAPDLFLYAASQMQYAANNAIVVEDSVNGVLGGKAAQMFTIGFTGGSHCVDGHDNALKNAGADIVMASHTELQNWLAENT